MEALFDLGERSRRLPRLYTIPPRRNSRLEAKTDEIMGATYIAGRRDVTPVTSKWEL